MPLHAPDPGVRVPSVFSVQSLFPYITDPDRIILRPLYRSSAWTVKYFSAPPGDSFTGVRRDASPDPAAGSALCGQNGSVLLLANSTVEKSSVLESVIEENASDISYLYILGGTSAVSDEIRQMIRSILEG